jgi:hypothetical protein
MIWLNNIIRVENMNKSLFVFMALICSISAFTLFQNKEAAELKAIPWPFSICGNGTWTIEKLTLASQPVRNANNDINVVRLLLFSLELPLPIPSSPVLTSTSNSMVSSSILKVLSSRNHTMTKILLSSNTKTSSPASLPLELTASLSPSRMAPPITDAWHSASSFDLNIPYLAHIQYH